MFQSVLLVILFLYADKHPFCSNLQLKFFHETHKLMFKVHFDQHLLFTLSKEKHLATPYLHLRHI